MPRISDVIALTETNINKNWGIQASLPDYNFIHCDSKAYAGGERFFIDKNLSYCRIDHLQFDIGGCENMWVEILLTNTTKVNIGVIYRHPKYKFSDFKSKLYETIQNFNLKNSTYYICGDINIDWLKRDANTNIKNYFESLENLDSLTLVTKPTQITV